MRVRSTIAVVLPGLLALILALSAPAGAAGAIALKVTPVPIRGFRNTGALRGGGAALKLALRISGTESDGAPSPVSELSLALPPGTRIDPAGFPTCPLGRLSSRGPSGCPADSQAGPEGLDRIAGLAEQELVQQLVKEEGRAQAFFAPGHTLDLYATNPFPLSRGMVAQGSLARHGALGGPELHLGFTPVPTIAGAPDVSLEALDFIFGGARRGKKGKVGYYLTLPRTCPSGGWRYQASITLQSTQVLAATGLIPCPRRAAPRLHRHHKRRHGSSHGKHPRA